MKNAEYAILKMRDNGYAVNKVYQILKYKKAALSHENRYITVVTAYLTCNDPALNIPATR
ncbi:hypothetical protein ABH892_001713 [Paenibacillus sp. RC254]